jgi:hypothetical protein
MKQGDHGVSFWELNTKPMKEYKNHDHRTEAYQIQDGAARPDLKKQKQVFQLCYPEELRNKTNAENICKCHGLVFHLPIITN